MTEGQLEPTVPAVELLLLLLLCLFAAVVFLATFSLSHGSSSLSEMVITSGIGLCTAIGG